MHTLKLYDQELDLIVGALMCVRDMDEDGGNAEQLAEMKVIDTLLVRIAEITNPLYAKEPHQ